jgi:hypothetical protein
MKAPKADFKIEKNIKTQYNPEFAAKMKRGEEDIKAGGTIKIEPADIWDLGSKGPSLYK